MCGIYAYFNFVAQKNRSVDLKYMAEKILHRGPDGIGYHADERVGLGNVRLSIIDPVGGKQPFYSDDNQVVVVQNGEIFNFRELRVSLEKSGFRFNTTCDTEVILALYLRYGIECLSKLNGMFGIAIYDRRIEKLFVARDRIGEKPLYYWRDNETYYFASEIKAFPGCVPRKVNRSAINAYLRLNYVPAPHTAFEDIYHVMPGTYLEVDTSGMNTHRWWDLADCEVDKSKSFDSWKQDLYSLLEDATKVRLVSDVPFGAFLSGGVDSSSVVGFMAKNMDQPVKTYSIGFPDPRFDESIYAQQAATRFKTDHHNEIVDFNIVDEWESFIYYCDQPHGDVSFLPMRRVSELAAKDVRMVLTGDGADELFAGYEKHVPFLSRSGLETLSSGKFSEGYMPHLTMMNAEFCNKLWLNEHKPAIDSKLVDDLVEQTVQRVQHFDPINRVLFLDMEMLLPGNNLVKPDRMAMSHSLETRAPFLDYRMMEFAFNMPGEHKLKNGDKKYIYKLAVEELIGRELSHRKKQMFTVPIGEWFKGQLANYCRGLLLSEESRLSMYFNLSVIDEIVSKHISGQYNYTREVRALISVELWLRRFF